MRARDGRLRGLAGDHPAPKLTPAQQMTPSLKSFATELTPIVTAYLTMAKGL